MKKVFLFIGLFCLLTLTYSQQVADLAYLPPIGQTAYETGKGPVVFIDEGHHNYHTKNGRYTAFARLLERDGYLVNSYHGTFEKEKLEAAKILVISNALNESNVEDWFLPNPSAFTREEIEIVRKWVAEGGSLFLIADHMPLGGAAMELALMFGFAFTNGFVFDTLSHNPEISMFTRSNGGLQDNLITNGSTPSEQVERIATFTGQGFTIPPGAKPILVLGDRHTNFLPDTAWVFDETTIRIPVTDWCQGAYMPYGQGKIVAFGEAAMFSAQVSGPEKRKMGMNNPIAPQNHQLLLNIIHWLDGKLE